MAIKPKKSSKHPARHPARQLKFPPPGRLTTPDIAKRLSLSITRVRDLMADGTISTTKHKAPGARNWVNLATEDEVNRLAAARGVLKISFSDRNKGMEEILTLVHEALKKTKNRTKPLTFAQLVEQIDRSPERVQRAIDILKGKGINIVLGADSGKDTLISLSGDLPPGGGEPLIVHPAKFWNNKWYECGLTGDNHLCVPGSASIQTSTGPKRMASIKVGDLVLTHKGRYRRVLKKFSSKCDRLVTIRVYGEKKNGTNSHYSLLCTPNHPVLVSRFGRDEWVPAGEVKKGDFVRVVSGHCQECPAACPPWAKTCDQHDAFVRDRYVSHPARNTRRAQSAPSRHYNEDIAPEMERWNAEGWRTIPVDKVRPDFVAIKDGRVVAVEVEAPKIGRPRGNKEKYASVQGVYDEVVWINKDPRHKSLNKKRTCLPANDHGFVAVRVTAVESFVPRSKRVYNIAVADDESYVVKGFVVHNCSKHERLDVLNSLYDMYASEGITEVYNTGNMIEGEMRLNRHDIKVFTLDGQVNYWIDQYPQRKGITTYFVTGDDHEGWYQRNNGMDIGLHMEQAAKRAGRKDLKYLGYVEADILLKAQEGERLMRIMHPGGGASYALSYASQKLVECVPMSTQALTPEGWKLPSELMNGDKILGYNQETGLCEWTVIKDMNFGWGEVVTYNNDNFVVRCTRDHRWPMLWESRGGKNPNSVEPSNYVREDKVLCTIDGAKDRSRIIQAAPGPEGPGVLFQGRDDLIERQACVAQVLRMSSMQRRAYIAGLLVGEGTKNPHSTGHRSTLSFSQRPGPVMDAFILACFLEGIATSPVHLTTKRLNGEEKVCGRVTLLKKSLRMVGSLREVDDSETEEDVWCPTTLLGTWVMRQGDLVTITGNSLQGGEKPAIFAYGHYHKFDYNFYREVHCIGTGCTVDQSIFMRKCKIQAHVGGVRLKINQAPDGQITRCMVEWMSFYDRGYYSKPRKF